MSPSLDQNALRLSFSLRRYPCVYNGSCWSEPKRIDALNTGDAKHVRNGCAYIMPALTGMCLFASNSQKEEA